MKYWNKARLRRRKARQLRAEEKSTWRRREILRLQGTYESGDIRKNALLMLEALGSEVNRNMLVRLRRRGAMSVSHLAEPFHITLPAAVVRVNTLERAGLITTHKRGRIRFCVYESSALKELATHLASRDPL